MKAISFIYKHVKTYPTNKGLSYYYSYSLVMSALVVLQIITGLFLSCFYVPHAYYAKSSVTYLMSEVNYGYLVRYYHIVIASFIFIAMYSHVMKALYYNSYTYRNRLTFWSRLLSWYLMIITAFTSYISPWRQMSFWRATVITNLFSIIPYIGPTLVKFIWRSSVVSNLTLKRFFMLHYLLPSFIIAMVIIHISSSHRLSSTNVVKSVQISDPQYRDSYHTSIIKNIFVLTILLLFASYLVFYNPRISDNPVNVVEDNNSLTPKHIVPE